MKASVRVSWMGAMVAVLCSGCLFSSREVTVSDVGSRAERREYYRNELINHDGLALESENFLRGNLLRDDLASDPVKVLKRIDEFYEISENPKYLVIAADICRYLATQVGEAESIRYYLSSYYYCTSFFRQLLKRGPIDASVSRQDDDSAYDMASGQNVQNYNEACGGIFSYLRNRNLLDATAVTLQDIEGRRFVLQKPEFRLSMPREAIEDFSLCAAYRVKNLMLMNREPGLGVPLVASVKDQQWYSSLRTPHGLTVPVTFSISREDRGNDSGDIPLKLKFIDTYRQEVFNENVNAGSRVNVKMALDFSTPLACFLDRLTERNLLQQMINPQDLESIDGLYMVEPYQPNKIPVVFIHGLMSSPETWVQMINALKNDPTIRKRYQFWFFSYSTGAPVIFSAKKLRTALLAAEKEFCTDPVAAANFNKMVLVGHSMGGLLTRLMVQKDPHYLFETVYNDSWDNIRAKLQPEDFELLDSFAPYSLPFVHRVVFMAVPHKGANMAQSFIGRLGSYLITIPKSLLSRETAISRINATLLPDSFSKPGMEFRLMTGIDNLDPDNKFVRVNGVSAMKDDLIYHCIIGNHDRAGAPDGSDGVVPYWSSHLDNAASELIVKSDHSVHRRPAAMQELLRILRLHLKSVDGK